MEKAPSARREPADRRVRRTIATIVFLAMAGPAARAQGLRDDTYAQGIKVGIDHLYRLDHDEALRSFSNLCERFSEHPGPYLAYAMAIWLRELFHRQELDLDKFISPGYFTRPAEREMPESDRKAFFDNVEKGRQLAEKYLQIHPGDKDARYYLGSAEGALGVFAFTIERSYLKALSHGRKSFQYQKDIIEDDPHFNDAYLTVGTYEYIVGRLPWYIKWIAAIIGFRGSADRGFEYLVRAAEKSRFVSNDARVLLMVLYVREKEYAYALQVAEQLHNRYPENFLLHLNQAQILEQMGERERAAKTYTEVVRLAEERRRNYQKLPLETFRYTAGSKLLDLGATEKALAMFLACTKDPETPTREKALSHLRAGEILDLAGRREEAVSHYRKVQQLQEVENSHEMARKYLNKPFRR